MKTLDFRDLHLKICRQSLPIDNLTSPRGAPMRRGAGRNTEETTMRKTTLRNALLLAIAGLVLAAGAAMAQPAPEYEVTIYNLTAGQPLSPPVVVTHSRDVAIFRVGEAALPELATLAEDGNPAPLADLLASLPQVADVAVAAGAVPPGGSTTVTVRGNRPFHRISAVGMLVNTNDAFFGLDTVTAPRRRFETLRSYALAYDAGSEANNESCDFIPGPACGGAGAGVRDEAGAEGFVYVHGGVHGVADLDPAATDWRNPVAKVVIRRVR